MTKILFFNSTDIDRMIFEGDEEASWQKTPRVSSLFTASQKTDVCLYGMPIGGLSGEHTISLIKLTTLANLFTTDFSMNEGFFPLLLNNDCMYFTDKAEYSFLDGNWALNNVYKVHLDKTPTFTSYNPVFPQGWQRCIVDSGNIRVGDLFSKVTEKLPMITEFCTKHQQEKVEITYSDRYVRDELSLIICLQFIKDLIYALNPTSYGVKMVGATFNEINANADNQRSLSGKAGLFISDKRRDEVGSELIQDNHYVFESKDKTEIPHYRELVVKAGNNVLRIMPDAGLAHWGLDIKQSKEDKQYYGISNGINSQIPVCSSTEQVYYVELENNR